VNAAGGRVYILPAPAINHSQRPCSAVVAKIEILHTFRYTTRTPRVRIFDIVNHQKNSAARPADGSRVAALRHRHSDADSDAHPEKSDVRTDLVTFGVDPQVFSGRSSVIPCACLTPPPGIRRDGR
jgi:hypothetical protein